MNLPKEDTKSWNHVTFALPLSQASTKSRECKQACKKLENGSLCHVTRYSTPILKNDMEIVTFLELFSKTDKRSFDGP